MSSNRKIIAHRFRPSRNWFGRIKLILQLKITERQSSQNNPILGYETVTYWCDAELEDLFELAQPEGFK